MKHQPPPPSTVRQSPPEWHMPLAAISNPQFSPPSTSPAPTHPTPPNNPLDQLFSDGSFLDASPIAPPDIDPVLSLSLAPAPSTPPPPLTTSPITRPVSHFRIPDPPTPTSAAPPPLPPPSQQQQQPQPQSHNIHIHHRKHTFIPVKDEPQIRTEPPSVSTPVPRRFPPPHYHPHPHTPPSSLQALQSADPDSLTPTERRRLRMFLRASRAGVRRARPSNTTDSNQSRPPPEINSSQVSSASNSSSFARLHIRNEATLPLVPVVPMKRENIIGSDKNARPAGVTKAAPRVDRAAVNPGMDKKTARVIRNREVALRARQAAKAKLQNLESENSTLRTRATDLEMENSTLKMQIESLKRTGNSSWNTSELTLDNIVHAITP